MYNNPYQLHLPMMQPYQAPVNEFYRGQVMCQPTQSQFITRMVGSIEEARAFIVDAFNTYLFVDTQTGKIYMKRMNNNGLSDFYTFSVEQSKQKDPFDEINKRLTRIEESIGGLNVQSVSNEPHTDDAKPDAPKNAVAKSPAVSEGTADD